MAEKNGYRHLFTIPESSSEEESDNENETESMIDSNIGQLFHLSNEKMHIANDCIEKAYLIICSRNRILLHEPFFRFMVHLGATRDEHTLGCQLYNQSYKNICQVHCRYAILPTSLYDNVVHSHLSIRLEGISNHFIDSTESQLRSSHAFLYKWKETSKDTLFKNVLDPVRLPMEENQLNFFTLHIQSSWNQDEMKDIGIIQQIFIHVSSQSKFSVRLYLLHNPSFQPSQQISFIKLTLDENQVIHHLLFHSQLRYVVDTVDHQPDENRTILSFSIHHLTLENYQTLLDFFEGFIFHIQEDKLYYEIPLINTSSINAILIEDLQFKIIVELLYRTNRILYQQHQHPEKKKLV